MTGDPFHKPSSTFLGFCLKVEDFFEALCVQWKLATYYVYVTRVSK